MNPPPFASMAMGGMPPGPVGASPSLPLAGAPPQPMVLPGQAPPPQLTPPAGVSGQAQAVQQPGATAPTPGGSQVPLPGAPPPGQVGAAAIVPGGVRMAAGVPPPSGTAPKPSPPPSAAFPAMRSFVPPPMMPNFMSAPPVPLQPQQMMPPGVLGNSPAGMPPRYTAPQFSPMAARPSSAFVPRPPLGPPPPVTMSAMSLPRPAGNGLRPIPPVLKPPPGMSLTELAAKGVGQLAAPPEKPHTTVYVGKIAPTIEDDFLRALLELCGEIKSWKRAQDPTTGSPKGFGFCEFESAEGVLRALRILNKYNLEGQELVLNVNQATREYLERYVAKKKEREKFLQQQAAEMEKDEELAPGVESIEAPKPSILFGKDDGAEKDSGAEEDAKKFGLVSSADIQADELATKKLNSMLEERSRLRPLPPPPPLPTSQDGLKSVDTASKSRDGDLSADAAKSDDPSGKNDDDTTSDLRASAENDMTSADKGRRTERDREREIEREKERELERYEMARERDRARRERDREMKIREAERIYEEREREWEAREREKERQRLHDREREKDRERDRRKEIKEQEDESDDEDWKKSRYRGSLVDEKRKRRLREREEDIADKEREEHEVLTKRQKIVDSASEKESDGEDEEMDVEEDEEEPLEVAPPRILATTESVTSVSDAEEELPQKILNSNGTHSTKRQTEEKLTTVVSSEVDPKASPAPRKLGFGIMGSGRRATGLSVFHQEEEEEKTDDRRLRPLVPIDYSAEEMEAVATPNPPPRASSPQVAPNLAAAAEFARSLSGFTGSNISSKEDRKEDGDRDRSRRKRDRHEERDSSRKERNRDRDRERDREREREERDREREREKDRERKDSDKEREKDQVAAEKIKVPEPKKILNAKQLIDTIPKTKEELFAFPVDWNIYDKHDLHERMRPWISKKITEFLGEEETTLVDFIVSNTCKHVTAASMLDLLESILDDEAELFVLKMWRMLIFEIRRIETGLASSKSKS